MTITKRLRMFAGPNGSGKTSLAMKLAREFSPNGLFRLHSYINPDDIHRALISGSGLPFADYRITVSWNQLRSWLAACGRLGLDHPFLKVARLENSLLTDPSKTCDPYVAGAIADFLREELYEAEQSFSFETVMSHPDKVKFFARAKAAGYRTYLYFVATESPALNLYRIANRVELGGHSVPEEKVIERYHRSLELLGEALVHAHRAYLFDNSGTEPIWLAELTPDAKLQLKISSASLPDWFRTRLSTITDN